MRPVSNSRKITLASLASERMVESMHGELTLSEAAATADLLPNATKEQERSTAKPLKEMVGTRRLELLTSTVSR